MTQSVFDKYREDTGCDVHCPDNQKILEKLVSNHVYANVTNLIEHLNTHCETLDTEDREIVDRLIGSVDYYTAAKHEITDVIENEFEDYLGVLDLEFLTDEIIARMSEIHSLEHYCRNKDIDLEEYTKDILSHFAVSEWLSRRLDTEGEAVEELFNMNIWGRKTNGQAISLDSAIATIAIKEGLLLGQRNCKYKPEALAA